MDNIDRIGNRIGIVGGGAAGLMAAGTAVSLGAEVVLFEKNKQVGRKLSITGKGRCNVTNNCDTQTLIANVLTNPRFLYTAANAFKPADTMRFFEDRGVKLKTERGNRVFPASDKAADIVNALQRWARGAEIVYETVKKIDIADGAVRGIVTAKNEYRFDSVIICTGGRSYPMTGSDGDGYRFAHEAGLEVTPLKPSLVPLEALEPWCAQLQGLSLRNASVSFVDTRTGKTVYEDFGELMFTHFGVSGPVILSASAHLKEMEPGRYLVKIDMKPALDAKTLDARLLGDFSKYTNKNFSNALDDLLPRKMIPVFIDLSGIESERKVNAITKEERKKLLDLLKGLTLTISRFRPLTEAIVTSGGVDVKELNPKTMESKKINGLYFAGEVIDVDAYTGGFNLQIAFSTAYLAAMSAALKKNLHEE